MMTAFLRYWQPILLAILVAHALAILLILSLRSDDTITLTIGAGRSNSEPYEVAQAISDVVRSALPHVHIKLVETGGSSNNIQLLSEKKLDLTMVQADVISRQNVTILAELYPDVFQLLVRSSSNIHKIKDLENHKIALPPFTSAQYRAFWFLANHYGLAPERIHAFAMPIEDAQKALEEGRVDAIFRVRGPRNSKIRSLIGKVDLRMLPIDQGAALHLRQPAFRSSTIPKGSYRGEPPIPATDLPTIAVDRLLLARKDLDPELVKAITKTLFEERRNLILRMPLASFIRQPNISSGTMLPVHDGAMAYFDREKPSFLEEKAELFAFLLSMAVVIGSSMLGIKRLLDERKKSRVSEYTAELIQLEKDAKQSRTIPDLNVYKDRLSAVLATVVEDMRHNRVNPEGLQFFAFTWESVNSTINDHEEQLRLGPEITPPPSPSPKA